MGKSRGLSIPPPHFSLNEFSRVITLFTSDRLVVVFFAPNENIFLPPLLHLGAVNVGSIFKQVKYVPPSYCMG